MPEMDSKQLLAQKLYDQKRLGESYRQGGTLLPWEPQEAKAFIREKAAQFAQDPALFESESRRMANYQANLPALYKPFVNEKKLTDAALFLVAKRHGGADLEEEYYEGARTALTWRHGKPNPEQSNVYFEVESLKVELTRHIISQDRNAMLGRHISDESGFNRALGEWKYGQSEGGKKSGKIVFFDDAPGSERYLMRLGLLAGIGVQHISPQDAGSARNRTT